MDEPTAPSAPEAVDPAKASIEYLVGKDKAEEVNGITDPYLQNTLIQAEATYRPQYIANNLAATEATLWGTGGQAGSIDQLSRATQESTAITNAANTATRAAAVSDVANLSAQARAAYESANPEQKAQIAKLVASQSNPLTANLVTPSTGTASTYGASTMNAATYDAAKSDAASAAGISRTPIQQELEKQAMSDLAAGRNLTASEQRDAQQAARVASGARGRILSNQGIGDEVLMSNELANQREASRREFAGQVGATGLQIDTANANIGVQNAQLAQQTALANQSAANVAAATNTAALNSAAAQNQAALNTTAAQNAAATNAMTQTNLSAQNQAAQANASALNSTDQYNRNYGLSVLNAVNTANIDPFAAIAGMNSTAVNTAVGQTSAGTTNSLNSSPQLFDLSVGLNTALANNANLANYNANIYGADAAYQGAINSQIMGGIMDMAASQFNMMNGTTAVNSVGGMAGSAAGAAMI